MRLAVALILISLSQVACWSEVENDPSAGANLLPQNSTSAPEPRVAAAFQPEIARARAEGLQLKEAVEADLEPNVHHLVAVFERAKPKAPNESHEFRIIQADGQPARTIFRRAEFFFSLASAAEMAGKNVADINGDGTPEVIVQSSSGGNCWSCNPTEIYRVKAGKGSLIAAGPITKIADLNNDGIVELIAADPRWEFYGDLSHAASPFSSSVYAWRNGQYVYASKDFPAYYKAESDRLHGALEQARGEITADEFSDEGYVGLAVSIAVTYAHMGEPDRGVKELESMLNANAKSAEQKRRRAEIIKDFQSGNSAKRLREMKYGDPMV